MKALRDLPFRHQLGLVVTLTSGLAVGLAAVGTLWFEHRQAYSNIRNDSLSLARIVAASSEAALSFADSRAAHETLAALAVKPEVMAARLDTVTGRPLASYRRQGGEAGAVPDVPEGAGHRFVGDELVIVEPVSYDGERVGTLSLTIDTRPLTMQLGRSALILGLVFLTATALALAASSRLQAWVSGPILGVAGAVRAVTERRDYAVRVTPAGPGELRTLAEGFNEMLAQLQERDGALRAARDGLELKVEERLRELQREVGVRRTAEARSELLSHAIESSTELISITDTQDRFTFVNRAFLDAYGYSQDEILGRELSLIDSPHNPAGLRATIGPATHRGGWRGELLNRRRDGSEFAISLSTSVIRDEQGHVVGLLGVANDITEARLKDERLRLQGAALESAADAVVITARDGTILWVNSAFSQLTGFAPEEAIGRKPSILRSGKQDEAVYRGLWQTILAGEVWSGELINKRKDGRLYVAAQTITPVRDGASEITHFVGVNRDISRGRQLEEQLRQAQRMEAVGRLSGGVAHDFNNLLSVILGFGEKLVRRLPPDEALRRYGHQILKAAQRGAGLTRQLLAFSRQQMLQPRVVDLNVIVSEAEQMLGRLIGEDIELVALLDPGLGTVKVDPGQIEQLLMNLAVNARDAMPQGGTLTLETGNHELTDAEAGQFPYSVRPGPYVQVTVSDTGTGMEPDTLDHVFEPFFTTKEAGKGTGLGLSTVYGIVKQSSGYIWVDSNPGQGTRIRVLLPRVSRPVECRGESSDLGEPGGAETVLVVEDDESARTLWRETLEELGYQVIEARDGVEAIEVAGAQQGRLDLLLTDVVMPKTGGRELAERLTAIRPGLRVVFMSGYTADALLRQGIAETSCRFLQKPFSGQQLARVIRDALDSPRPGLTTDSVTAPG